MASPPAVETYKRSTNIKPHDAAAAHAGCRRAIGSALYKLFRNGSERRNGAETKGLMLYAAALTM